MKRLAAGVGLLVLAASVAGFAQKEHQYIVLKRAPAAVHFPA